MRPLALARYRIWTSIRAANPVMLFCAVPPVVAALAQTVWGMSDSFPPDILLRLSATAALFSWCIHGTMVAAAAREFGNASRTSASAVHPSDLMDSVPVEPAARATGEFTGFFASAMLVHICCFPLLVVVAALSPLPTIFFAWIEGAILAVLVLASASGSWFRVVVGSSRRVGMRPMRNSAFFLLGIVITIVVTTRPIAFRDAFFSFFIAPSTAAWWRLVGTIERPEAMIAFLTALYAGYFSYFVLSCIGHRPQE